MPAGQKSRAEWLYQAQWGVFIHFLGAAPSTMGGGELTAEEWNKQVDRFDVKGLARQLHEIQAPYIIITIGQNSGHYCSPNATYDRIVGYRPSKCSRRDLVADLYDALVPYGIKLLVYLPAFGPGADTLALKKLKCTPAWEPTYTLADKNSGVDDRLTEFQRNWEAIMREWSLRWGKKIWGWWIDGCYFNERLYEFPDEPNFKSFAAAMRAGNPDSIVAWNPGVVYPPRTVNAEEDYTAGEINEPEKVAQLGRWVKQAQFHVLTFIGASWMAMPVQYSAEELVDDSLAIIDCGGVITWDVPHTPEGLIVADAYGPIKALGEVISRHPRDRVTPAKLPQSSFKLIAAPYITTAGKVMPGKARVLLHNHWPVPVSGTVNLQPSGTTAPVARAVPMKEYRIDPGQDQEIEMDIGWPRAEAEKAKIKLTVSQADGKRSVHYPLPVRQAIKLPVLPAGTRLDDLPQALAKAPPMAVRVSPMSDPALVEKKIADIRLGWAGNCLAILAEVEDARRERTPDYWDGSCLEIFAVAGDSAPIGQVFLMPTTRDKGDEVMRVKNGKWLTVPEVEFRARPNAKGYTGWALIPIPWFIGAEHMPDRILFEMAVSAGVGQVFRRGMLFGEWYGSQETAGYAMLCRA